MTDPSSANLKASLESLKTSIDALKGASSSEAVKAANKIITIVEKIHMDKPKDTGDIEDAGVKVRDFTQKLNEAKTAVDAFQKSAKDKDTKLGDTAVKNFGTKLTELLSVAAADRSKSDSGFLKLVEQIRKVGISTSDYGANLPGSVGGEKDDASLDIQLRMAEQGMLSLDTIQKVVSQMSGNYGQMVGLKERLTSLYEGQLTTRKKIESGEIDLLKKQNDLQVMQEQREAAQNEHNAAAAERDERKNQLQSEENDIRSRDMTEDSRIRLREIENEKRRIAHQEDIASGNLREMESREKLLKAEVDAIEDVVKNLKEHDKAVVENMESLTKSMETVARDIEDAILSGVKPLETSFEGMTSSVEFYSKMSNVTTKHLLSVGASTDNILDSAILANNSMNAIRMEMASDVQKLQEQVFSQARAIEQARTDGTSPEVIAAMEEAFSKTVRTLQDKQEELKNASRGDMSSVVDAMKEIFEPLENQSKIWKDMQDVRIALLGDFEKASSANLKQEEKNLKEEIKHRREMVLMIQSELETLRKRYESGEITLEEYLKSQQLMVKTLNETMSEIKSAESKGKEIEKARKEKGLFGRLEKAFENFGKAMRKPANRWITSILAGLFLFAVLVRKGLINPRLVAKVFSLIVGLLVDAIKFAIKMIFQGIFLWLKTLVNIFRQDLLSGVIATLLTIVGGLLILGKIITATKALWLTLNQGMSALIAGWKATIAALKGLQLIIAASKSGFAKAGIAGAASGAIGQSKSIMKLGVEGAKAASTAAAAAPVAAPIRARDSKGRFVKAGAAPVAGGPAGAAPVAGAPRKGVKAAAAKGTVGGAVGGKDAKQTGGILHSLARGLRALGTPRAMKGALTIGILATSMIPFATALRIMKGVGISTVFTFVAAVGSLVGMSILLAKNDKAIYKGGLALAAMGASILPFAYSMSLLKGMGVFEMASTMAVLLAAILVLVKITSILGSIGKIAIKGLAILSILSLNILAIAASLYLAAQAFSIAVNAMKEIDMGGLLKFAAAMLVMTGAMALAGAALPLMAPGILAIGMVAAGAILFSYAMKLLADLDPSVALNLSKTMAFLVPGIVLAGALVIPIALASASFVMLGASLTILGIGLKMIGDLDPWIGLKLTAVILGLSYGLVTAGILFPIIALASASFLLLGSSLILLGAGLRVIGDLNPLMGLKLTAVILGLSYGLATAGILSPLIALASVVFILLGTSLILLGAGLRMIGDLDPLMGIKLTAVILGLSYGLTIAGILSPLIALASIAFFALGLSLISLAAGLALVKGLDPTVGLNLSLAILSLVPAFTLAGLLSPLILLGSLAIGSMVFGISLFSLAMKMVGDINLDMVRNLDEAIRILAWRAVKEAAFAPLIMLGSLAIGALGLGLIPFAKSMAILNGVVIDLEQIKNLDKAIRILSWRAVKEAAFVVPIALGALAIGLLGKAILPMVESLVLLKDIDPFTPLLFSMAVGILTGTAVYAGLHRDRIEEGSAALESLAHALRPFVLTMQYLTGVDANAMDAFARAVRILTNVAIWVGMPFINSMAKAGAETLEIVGTSLRTFARMFKSISDVPIETIAGFTVSVMLLTRTAMYAARNKEQMDLGSEALDYLGKTMASFGRTFAATKEIELDMLYSFILGVQTLKDEALHAGSFMKEIVFGSIGLRILADAMKSFAESFQMVNDINLESVYDFAIGIEELAFSSIGLAEFFDEIISGSKAIDVLGSSIMPFAKSMTILSGVIIDLEQIRNLDRAIGIISWRAVKEAAWLPAIALGSAAIYLLGRALLPFAKSMQMLRDVTFDREKILQLDQVIALFSMRARNIAGHAIHISLSSIAIRLLGESLFQIMEVMKTIRNSTNEGVVEFLDSIGKMLEFINNLRRNDVNVRNFSNVIKEMTNVIPELENLASSLMDVNKEITTLFDSLAKSTGMGENLARTADGIVLLSQAVGELARVLGALSDEEMLRVIKVLNTEGKIIITTTGGSAMVGEAAESQGAMARESSQTGPVGSSSGRSGRNSGKYPILGTEEYDPDKDLTDSQIEAIRRGAEASDGQSLHNLPSDILDKYARQTGIDRNSIPRGISPVGPSSSSPTVQTAARGTQATNTITSQSGLSGPVSGLSGGSGAVGDYESITPLEYTRIRVAMLRRQLSSLESLGMNSEKSQIYSSLQDDLESETRLLEDLERQNLERSSTVQTAARGTQATNTITSQSGLSGPVSGLSGLPVPEYGTGYTRTSNGRTTTVVNSDPASIPWMNEWMRERGTVNVIDPVTGEERHETLDEWKARKGYTGGPSSRDSSTRNRTFSPSDMQDVPDYTDLDPRNETRFIPHESSRERDIRRLENLQSRTRARTDARLNPSGLDRAANSGRMLRRSTSYSSTDNLYSDMQDSIGTNVLSRNLGITDSIGSNSKIARNPVDSLVDKGFDIFSPLPENASFSERAANRAQRTMMKSMVKRKLSSDISPLGMPQIPSIPSPTKLIQSTSESSPLVQIRDVLVDIRNLHQENVERQRMESNALVVQTNTNNISNGGAETATRVLPARDSYGGRLRNQNFIGT